MKKEDKKIKYKGNGKKSNYLSNPNLFQPYIIINTQKFEEIKSNSLIENSVEKFSSNVKYP